MVFSFLGGNLESFGILQDLSLKKSVKVDYSYKRTLFEASEYSKFIPLNGFCAWNISVENLNFLLVRLGRQFKFKIYIANTKKSPYYMLDTTSLSGDLIDIEDKKARFYSISFEEVHWLEDAGECIAYGEEAQYLSYADCVAKEHAEIFHPILGCRPPWLSTQGHPDNCKGQIFLTTKHLDNWLKKYTLDFTFGFWLSGKAHSEKCLKPCKGRFASSKMNYVKDNMTTPMVYLSFQKEVKVTKYVRSYDLFNLVVDVGSSLGLWIGLSIVDVFDLVLDAGIFISKWYVDRKKITKG